MPSWSIQKSKVKYFDRTFSVTVENKAYKTKGVRQFPPSLLRIFEVYKDTTDSVKISFNNKDELILTYRQPLYGIVANTFKGHFTKRGYYEFYFEKKSLEIPPGFPIIYSARHINVIRMALTYTGELIVENKWNQSGNIFFLAAGDKGRRWSFFKCHTTKQ